MDHLTATFAGGQLPEHESLESPIAALSTERTSARAREGTTGAWRLGSSGVDRASEARGLEPDSGGSDRAQVGDGREEPLLVSEHHAHLMRATVIDERDCAGVAGRAVQLRLGDSPAPALGVRDSEPVERAAEAPDGLVVGPGR